MQSSEFQNEAIFILLLITLGVMTAFGPLTIDMYVPSLPKVQGDFGSTTSEIQLTLSFTMIGLALGQFIFGPLSDAFWSQTHCCIHFNHFHFGIRFVYVC